MDFISIMPGSTKNKGKIKNYNYSQHAKKLRKALNDNIDRFEHRTLDLSRIMKNPNFS